mgnify:CR=1 FL=1
MIVAGGPVDAANGQKVGEFFGEVFTRVYFKVTGRSCPRVPSCAFGQAAELGDAEQAQHPEHVEGEIHLPPAEALASGALVPVVVVVPSLAEGRQRDEERVAAGVVGRVRPATEDVRHRVHEERRVPQENRRTEEPDDEAAPAADEIAGDPERPRADPVVPVEKTDLGEGVEVAHLGAPRLLVTVGEDPPHVAPEEPVTRRVEVALGVGVAVVRAVVARPPQRTLLRGGETTEGEYELPEAAEAVRPVGEVPVVRAGDEEDARPVGGEEEDRRGARHAGYEGEEADGVHEEERDRGDPVDPTRTAVRRFGAPGQDLVLGRRLRNIGHFTLPTCL